MYYIITDYIYLMYILKVFPLGYYYSANGLTVTRALEYMKYSWKYLGI